jgi:hypothetical protein
LHSKRLQSISSWKASGQPMARHERAVSTTSRVAGRHDSRQFAKRAVSRSLRRLLQSKSSESDEADNGTQSGGDSQRGDRIVAHKSLDGVQFRTRGRVIFRFVRRDRLRSRPGQQAPDSCFHGFTDVRSFSIHGYACRRRRNLHWLPSSLLANYRRTRGTNQSSRTTKIIYARQSAKNRGRPEIGFRSGLRNRRPRARIVA